MEIVGSALMAFFAFVLAAWGGWLRAIVRRRVHKKMVPIIDNHLCEKVITLGFFTGLGILLYGKLS